jgi:hypothetical protein
MTLGALTLTAVTWLAGLAGGTGGCGALDGLTSPDAQPSDTHDAQEGAAGDATSDVDPIVDGGTPEAGPDGGPRVLRKAVEPAPELLVDDQNVYYLESAYPFKVSIPDGTPTELTRSFPLPQNWVQDQDALYYYPSRNATDQGITRLAKSSPPTDQRVISPNGEYVVTQSGIVGLAIDATYVYYAMTRGANGVDTAAILRTPKTPTGELPSMIGACHPLESVVAVDDKQVYVVDRTAGSIAGVGIQSGVRTDLVLGQDGPRDVRLVGTRLYFVNELTNTVKVSDLAASGPPTTLFQSRDVVSALQVDGDALAWAAGSGVFTCVLADCAHTTRMLATAMAPQGLVVGKAGLFWVDGTDIMWLPR